MIFPSSLSYDKPLRHIGSMKELDYPWQTGYFRAEDGLELAYGDLGKGAPILFIHGLGSYGPAWLKNAEELQSGFRCIIPDLPGYGKSGKEGFEVGIKAFGRRLFQLADSLDVGQFYIAGHSMGGQIAMRMATMDPGRIKGLMLSAPAGFEQFTEAENEWMQRFYAADIIRYSLPAQVYMNYTQNFFVLPEDALFMVRHRIEMSFAKDFPLYCKVVPDCIKAMQEDRPESYIHLIKQPVFALYGKEDRLIPNLFLHPGLKPEDIANRAKEMLPQIEMELIPETGHFPHWEQCDRFNSKMRHLSHL